MLLGEVARVARLQINHANHSVLGDKRYRQFGAHVGYGRDISRILSDIVDQNRPPDCAACPVTPSPSLTRARSAKSAG